MSKKRKLKFERKMVSNNSKGKLNSIVIMISIGVIVVGLFGIVYILTRGKSNSINSEQAKVEVPVDNVIFEGDKQIVEIGVKGGYNPQKSIAKAGLPTILRFKTNSTYDCSSSVRIPSLNISKNLPGTGTTEVEIGTQSAGKLSGICGMGMYSFEIDFQS